MAEIKRKPILVKITNGDEEQDLIAFDEDHTIGDILRYLISCADADEVVSVLTGIIKEET